MTDPEARRVLTEAGLTGFELVRYMLETSGGRATTEDVAEKVLRYQAAVLAVRGDVGEHLVSVAPEQVLLYAQLANMASVTFAAMCQLRAGREMSAEELTDALAQYQEMLLLGGSL